MKTISRFASVCLLLNLSLACVAQEQKPATPPAPASTAAAQMVTVEPGVRLEVLDWGGTGRPVILLAGLNGTAHVFDSFAPKLTAKYHVYGITRRGMGSSDTPAAAGDSYSADRLGDDVLAVMGQLKIVRPVLIGHSLAGEELSSIGSRFPDRVAGLVYLDAGYPYAFYNAAVGDLQLDTFELRRRLDAYVAAATPQQQRAAGDALLAFNFDQYRAALKAREEALKGVPDRTPPTDAQLKARNVVTGRAIMAGEERYTHITCPVLAIFALPHDQGIPAGPARDKADAADLKETGAQADAFAAGVPQAKVVRIAHANHFVFRSNEAQVLAEIDGFVAGLK